MRKKSIIGGVFALLALLLSTVGVLNAHGLNPEGSDADMIVEVTLTNLTRGQIFSPIFFARHDGHAESLYVLGAPASDALAAMAEDADASGLMEAYGPQTNGNVSEMLLLTLEGGPIPPGHSVSVEFRISDGKELLSLASMLVSTNDGFVGVSGLDVSTSSVTYLPVYDAGSEANSEDCAYIPGPPCGNHVEDPADSEGYVHVHAGIHGGGGLDPAQHDWRNPAARLTVKTWVLSE